VLGFYPRLMSEVRRLSSLPYGMLLVTGDRQRQDHDSLGAISETQTAATRSSHRRPGRMINSGVLQIP